MPDDVVFLIDCDNTLVDNDGIQDDLRDRFARDFGTAGWDRYQAIFEALRAEVGYSDYLGALQRYRLEAVSDTRLLSISSFLLDYPFATPAGHYIVVDDKLRLLTAIKQIWGERVTTVFPRQGHYAHDPAVLATYPPADLTVESIGELVTFDLPALLGASTTAAPPEEHAKPTT